MSRLELLAKGRYLILCPEDLELVFRLPPEVVSHYVNKKKLKVCYIGRTKKYPRFALNDVLDFLKKYKRLQRGLAKQLLDRRELETYMKEFYGK